ncbi:MAG TPA: glycine cleavage system protein GcvH [Roseiarcus sp.]|nr:glycine cleavage system protein GcvH [Roseiarcus sp.]
MSQLRYSKDHEYIRLEGEIGTVGISDHAQAQLGDVVFVELPQVGAQLVQGGEAAVVESVKAASEVYAPATGEVVAVNDALEGQPSLINEDATGKGWLFRVKLADPKELESMMDEAAYQEFLKTEA